MKPIRVVLADDHALVRAGIRTLCESLDGVTMVAEADDGNQALKLVKAHHPDAVLMDIAMKALNGLDATHRTQIMERLDIHDIAGLVRFAIRVGLVSSDK